MGDDIWDMQRLLIVASGFILALAGGCGQVSRSDVQGSWSITPSACKSLKNGGTFADSRFIFHETGEFEVHDIPWHWSVGPGDPEPMSGRGKWRLISEDGQKKVLLDMQRRMPDGSNQRYGFTLDIDKNAFDLTLLYYLGDPDEGHRITYAKQNRPVGFCGS